MTEEGKKEGRMKRSDGRRGKKGGSAVWEEERNTDDWPRY